MAKPNAQKVPMLKEAWDEYGMTISWDQLFDMKMRSDKCYVVVAWRNKTGMVEMADLVRGDIEDPWEVQNDGFTPITEADWKKLKIKPECDWFLIPGNPDFLQT